MFFSPPIGYFLSEILIFFIHPLPSCRWEDIIVAEIKVRQIWKHSCKTLCPGTTNDISKFLPRWFSAGNSDSTPAKLPAPTTPIPLYPRLKWPRQNYTLSQLSWKTLCILPLDFTGEHLDCGDVTVVCQRCLTTNLGCTFSTGVPMVVSFQKFLFTPTTTHNRWQSVWYLLNSFSDWLWRPSQHVEMVFQHVSQQVLHCPQEEWPVEVLIWRQLQTTMTGFVHKDTCWFVHSVSRLGRLLVFVPLRFPNRPIRLFVNRFIGR